MNRLWARIAICACLVAAASVSFGQGITTTSDSVATPVHEVHLREIRDLFKRYGVPHAEAGIDRYGRVLLRGTYADREEVEIAHSIVQSVVGVSWTSFVTPENVRLTNLQKGSQQALSQLFKGVVAKQGVTGGTGTPSGSMRSAQIDNADQAPGPIKRRFALVMGVGEFTQRGINPLQYAASDASSVYQFLVDPSGGKFKAPDVTLITNREATSAAVLAWLDRIERVAAPDDLVLMYASTHGSSPDSEGLMAVITYDTVVDRPAGATLRKTSVPGTRLASFVQTVRAKRLLIILDTCYSAAAFTDVPGYSPRDAVALGVGNEIFGVRRETIARMVGSKDLLREDDMTLGASLTQAGADRDAWGRVFITASGPDQRSWESQNLKASFFTHYFMRGLRTTGNVRDAFAYSRQIVPGEVMLEKKAAQTPTVYNTQSNWSLTF